MNLYVHLYQLTLCSELEFWTNPCSFFLSWNSANKTRCNFLKHLLNLLTLSEYRNLVLDPMSLNYMTWSVQMSLLLYFQVWTVVTWAAVAGATTTWAAVQWAISPTLTTQLFKPHVQCTQFRHDDVRENVGPPKSWHPEKQESPVLDWKWDLPNYIFLVLSHFLVLLIFLMLSYLVSHFVFEKCQ